MDDKQKYEELLKALAELINAKNTDISLKNYEIATLKSKLQVAEKQICELRKEK